MRTVSGRAHLGRKQKVIYVDLGYFHLCRLRILGYFRLDPPKRGSALVGTKRISVQRETVRHVPRTSGISEEDTVCKVVHGYLAHKKTPSPRTLQ